MAHDKMNVSGTTEGVVAAGTLTPTIASDGKWSSGLKGVLMDCPLDIAWAFFSDWANWGRWLTASLICELPEGENRKPGSMRFLKCPGWWLNERILEIDNEKHFCSYSIEENDVFGGLKGFFGCIQFQESGDGKTMVEYWKYEFEPVENQTPESFCGFVNNGLKGILAELERGATRHAAGLDHDSLLLQQYTKGDGQHSATLGTDNRGEELALVQKAPSQRASLLQEVVRQCWIAVPMICVNLLQYSITVLSVMFVGHLGEFELASASIANSLAAVLGYYVLLGMGSVLETLCGQAYGAAQYHMLGVYLQRAFLVLFITCLPLSFVFLHMEDILVFVGQDPEIANKAGEYSVYLLPSLFGYALLQPVVKFLQTQSVVIPMLVCSATTLVLHAGILYSFIYTLGLGFRGAAMATSLSFWINAILLIIYAKFSEVCKETWKGFTREAFVGLYEFLELAVPSCVMICLEFWCFEILVMASGLLPNPTLELSALSVCLSTITLNYMIPFGLSAAASTRVSNELGAGNARAAKYAVYVTMSMSAFQATIVGSVLVALRFHWGWLYSNEAEVVHYVGTIMPFLACIALFDGIQGVLSGVARGCGRQELGAWINLCTFYIIGVPAALVLAFHFNMDGRGLFTGLLCGLGTQMLTLTVVTLRTDWDKQVQIATARVSHDKHEGLAGFEKVPNDII